MVTGTKRKAVIIYVLQAHAPLYLLHFFLKTVGGITKTLENTGNGGYIVIIPLYTIRIILIGLAFVLFRISRHQKFIGISRNGELVILIYRNEEIDSQT